MKPYNLILFLVFSVFGYGQQSISGIVTDTKNNPLTGVDIYIEELQKGISTNNAGLFKLTNLPNAFKITATFIGYETQTKTINLTQNETVLNFTLEEAIFKMEEIIISTPFNKLQSENVMKVERATVQQLKNKGVATLIEGISTIAGVSQVSTGIGIGKPVIRGLRGNRVLIYTQNIRLENQQFGDEHGLGIDESSIESIEVIKGPASLLYGSDALGGVLYFNPTKFARENTLNFNFNQKYFSNTLGNSTTFGVKKSYTSWKYITSGSYNSHSDYKIPNGSKVTNTRFNETIFNSAINYNNNLFSSTLRFNLNNTTVGIPDNIGIQNNRKTPLLPFQDLNNKMVSFNSILFLRNSKVTSTFGYTDNDRKEFEEHEKEIENAHNQPLDPALHLKLKTLSYDLKWHLPKFQKFETIIGIQGLHQINKNYGEEILIPNAEMNDFGLLLTSSYDWDGNSIQGGIRFDTRSLMTEKHTIIHEDKEHIFEAIDKSFKNITASLGYKTTIFKKVISRFNFASGYRAPNLAELTSNGVHHGSNRFEIGNNNLKSEQNFQSDIALEYNTNHFEFFVNGFYNHINNYIFISPTGELKEENYIYQYRQDKAKLYGGEFGFHLHPHPLDWLHLNSTYEFVIGKQNNENYLPLIPANKLTNTLRSEFNNTKKLENGFIAITLETTFKQSKISEFEIPTNSYSLINIGAGGKITLSKIDFNINFNINNLLNKEYISHLSRLKTDEIYNIGRNFIASVKFSI